MTSKLEEIVTQNWENGLHLLTAVLDPCLKLSAIDEAKRDLAKILRERYTVYSKQQFAPS